MGAGEGLGISQELGIKYTQYFYKMDHQQGPTL